LLTFGYMMGPGSFGGGPGSLRLMANVTAPLTGTVWKIQVAVGDPVAEGQTVVILESMKMEMPVEAPEAGKVSSVAVREGQAVEEGDVLLSLA
jgi:acetyl-CoA carboxylase biotin carboxyl carrier protein